MGEPKPCGKCGKPYFPLRRSYCHGCDMHRRLLFGYESSFVDAQPAREHVVALQAAGVGLRRISALTGVSRSALRCLLTGRDATGGRPATGPSKRISKKTADRLLAVEMPEHRALKLVVNGGTRVPVLGSMRRVRALIRFGYTQTALAEHIGWSVTNLNSQLVHPRQTMINATTARKVEAMFDELQMTPGPSDRARRMAKKRNWVLPMAWDEDSIDVPDAVHVAGAHRPKGFKSGGFVQTYLELRDLGMGDTAIAAKMGIAWDSFLTSKRRNSAELAYEDSLEGMTG